MEDAVKSKTCERMIRRGRDSIVCTYCRRYQRWSAGLWRQRKREGLHVLFGIYIVLFSRAGSWIQDQTHKPVLYQRGTFRVAGFICFRRSWGKLVSRSHPSPWRCLLNRYFLWLVISPSLKASLKLGFHEFFVDHYCVFRINSSCNSLDSITC